MADSCRLYIPGTAHNRTRPSSAMSVRSSHRRIEPYGHRRPRARYAPAYGWEIGHEPLRRPRHHRVIRQSRKPPPQDAQPVGQPPDCHRISRRKRCRQTGRSCSAPIQRQARVGSIYRNCESGASGIGSLRSNGGHSGTMPSGRMRCSIRLNRWMRSHVLGPDRL
jgi:hypothetical protein